MRKRKLAHWQDVAYQKGSNVVYRVFRVYNVYGVE